VAKSLQSAIAENERQHGSGVGVGMPFERGWSREDPKFYALPQPNSLTNQGNNRRSQSTRLRAGRVNAQNSSLWISQVDMSEREPETVSPIRSKNDVEAKNSTHLKR